MDSKLMQQVVALTVVLTGVVMVVQADPQIVTGDKAPSDYTKTPSAQIVSGFIKSNPNPTPGDMETFSATIERGNTALVSNTAAPSIARTRPMSSAALGKVSLPSSTLLAAFNASSSSLCPQGFVAYPTGSSFCEQDTVNQDGNIVATTLFIGPEGKGLTYTSDIGGGDSSETFTYGFILQRVEDPHGGVFYVGQYDNYFLSSVQDAVNWAITECRKGFPVTYVGASGTIDPKTGVPSGGYQVQVVDYIPGAGPDPSDMSPIPQGDTNFCLTLPPPVNNG